MQLADLKRPRAWIPLCLVLLLAVGLAVVFNPAFQKKMLLDHVGPLVDSLEIGHVHFTPWSLDLSRVSVDYRGGHFQVGEGKISYCLSSLLVLDLNIKQVVLQGVNIDVANYKPPETESPDGGIFPGVLASLEHGLGYILQELMVSAAVTLPGQQSLTVDITGGDIRPGKQGAINLNVRFNTGKADDHILVAGRLAFDQLSRGRFSAVESELDVQASLAELPQTERINIRLGVTPAAPAIEQATVTEDDGKPRYTPEALHLAMEQNDVEGKSRSALDLTGAYDGNSGEFTGSYRVTANERLVQPYLKTDTLPPAEQVLTGKVLFNTAEVTGDLTVISELQVTDLQNAVASKKFPKLLRLANNFRVTLLPDRQLRVVTLDAGITDEKDYQPLVASLPGDLQIPLENVDAFLHKENTLLEFELPGIPLTWFDAFLPGYEITQGHLTAAFRITTDDNSVIHLLPVKPLKITGLTILQSGAVLVDDMNLSVQPGVSYDAGTLRIALDSLVIDADQGQLATAKANASLRLAGDQPGAIDASADADLNVYNLLAFFDIKKSGRQGIPRHFSVDLRTAMQQQGNTVIVNRMDANLYKDAKTRLLKLALLQPLVVKRAGSSSSIANAEGSLAQLNITDIRLDWFSAFVPDAALSGRLHRADFTLATDAAGIATITAGKPFVINHVTVTGKDGPLVEDVGVSVRPAITLVPKGTQITYKDLDITSGQSSLVTGSGRITLPGTADQARVAAGHLDIDIQAIAQQPVVANALKGSIVAPARIEADYNLAQSSSRMDISRLAVNLFYTDPEPRLALTADSNVRVRTRLGRNQSELGRARGKVTLSINHLTPDPFVEILAANGLSFTEANGRAELTSDGKSLTVNSIEPFAITGIGVSGEDGALLNPFTVRTEAGVNLQGDTLQAVLHPFTLTFDRYSDSPAMDAKLDLTLKGDGEKVRVEDLDATLNLSLPAALDQPAILPNHTLKAGKMDASIRILPDGKLAAIARIHDLQGKDDLPLELLETNMDGQLDPDGSFTVTVPVRTVGKSGESDLLIKAVHSNRDGANDDLDGSINSTVFYLNDILNTVKAISGRQKTQAAAEKSPTEQAQQQDAEVNGMRPDVKAFWDTIPYNRHVSYNIGQLFYTDYLVIRDIKGQGEFTPERLSLDDFEARFHDSPISFNAVMTFTPGTAPYNLDLQAGVEQFDLAKFFRELVPGSRPRAEGLFNVSLNASGQSPNIPQYRNQLFFDMHLQSTNGIFRLLDPNSALVSGSTGFAGALGEGLSYIPTGLFGLGAAPRLVNYIKEIEYNKIDVQLVRDESRDVQIRRYVVQSPEILMTASGGIRYQEGVDIAQSPLEMDGQLDFRGHGAAIMYELDLLESEQDAYGYWKGPAIKFRGTPAASESNLGEIISTAGRAAFLGAITRPISGLIGNIKHRWLGDDSAPIEYKE